MVEQNQHLTPGRCGRLQAASGKIQHRSDFLQGHVEPFGDFVNCGAGLKILEYDRHRHSGILETHAPLTLPGMLSTMGHCDQSSVAMFNLSFHRSFKHGMFTSRLKPMQRGGRRVRHLGSEPIYSGGSPIMDNI